MAPGASGKRKRGDRSFSYDSQDGSRPSPHRPGSLSLAQEAHSPSGTNYNQHQRDQDQYGRGRRGGRGGGRGGGPPRSPYDSPSSTPAIRTAPISSGRMSPPPINTQDPVSLVKNNAPIQAPASTPIPLPQSTDASISLFPFEHLTSTVLKRWQESGRAAILESCLNARNVSDIASLSDIFQELIRSVAESRMQPFEAGSVMKEILLAPKDGEDETTPFDSISLFLDCLSILMETEGGNPNLSPMLQAAEIDSATLRLQLESSTLQSLGLVRDTFVRMGIRKTTNILYRQANYNLLREETEGYSKLITELFTTSSNEAPTPEVVEETFERVKGMIGTFDLDVGRVLDVTLDVFAAVLVKQYKFFVKYLRASSWWPDQPSEDTAHRERIALGGLPSWALPGAPFLNTSEHERAELAGSREERDVKFWDRVRQIGTKAYFELGNHLPAESSQHVPEEDQKWSELTGVRPPCGNKVAAQVLGFKLRFYSSPAREQSDTLPVNLIYLAALLIKIGFLSLRDLYPHLWPLDDAMEGVKEAKMNEKVEREKLNRPGGGAFNALTMAGALPDDTLPAAGRLREVDGNRGAAIPKLDSGAEKAAASAKVETETPLPEPIDQKVQLLKSLLCIGAVPEALYILGKFPWLPDAFPDLPEHIHRIIHHSLSKVYDPLQPMGGQSDLHQPQRITELDQSSVTKGQLRRSDPPVRKSLRWAQLDKEDTTEGLDYRFYWDDWADNVPICQTVDDVFTLCSTLLNYSGVKIGQDPALLLKLTRIGQHSLKEDQSQQNRTRWIDLCKRLLVPALSLTKCNPGVVNEVFELIQQFPTKVRFSFYAEWYTGSTSRQPDIKAAFDQCRAETKDVLKRISKTNVKSMARALAKVAYSSPGIVFSVAIGQIESYENLVEVVVECARYFTYLGYDVLTWSLMSSLGTKGRLRVQADGMLTSRWLAALSLFAGKVFKRYSMMNATPMLQYVTEQLREGNTTDLIVLEEMTSSMAGIVSDTNFNDAQINAMAGGPLLQSQTMLQLLDRRHESRTTARRLMKSLVEPRLAGQLLISIAQERQTSIYKIPEEDAHLKLLGNLHDEIHRVLTQYLDLLRSNLSVKEFDQLVPDLAHLVGDFGIDPSIAFWICRVGIGSTMLEHDSELAKRTLQESTTVTNADLNLNNGLKDVEMVDDVVPGPETAELDSTKPGKKEAVMTNEVPFKTTQDTEMKDEPNLDPSPSDAKIEPEAIIPAEPWHPILKEVMSSLTPVLTDTSLKEVGIAYYVTFWQLSLGDMQVPTQSYDDEIQRLKKRITAISSDRSDLTISGGQRREREKKTLIELQDKLRAELKDHIQTYSQTRSRLQKEKERWFPNAWGKWSDLNIALLESCFIPRALLSSIDAVYTFKMFKFLHLSGALNFRTMGVLDQIFNEKRLTSLFFLTTSKEAENFGRFLSEVLHDLQRWHKDGNVFEKEAYGVKKDLPGFSRKMSDTKNVATFYGFEDFRRVLLKWHRNLHLALKACIASEEYMHIRNAILILKSVCQYFPAVNWMGQAQIASMTELSKGESRDDLKLAALSLLGNLKRREKDWVLPQAFSLNESTPVAPGTVRSSSAKPSTPQPESRISVLNARAPEFKPSPPPNSNGLLKPPTAAPSKAEAEDGEIDDAPKSKSEGVAKSNPISSNPFPHAAKETSRASSPQPPLNTNLAPTAANTALSIATDSQSIEQPSQSQTQQEPSKPSKEHESQTPSSLPHTHPGTAAKSDSQRGMHDSAPRLPASLPNKPDVSSVRNGRDYREPRLPEPVRTGRHTELPSNRLDQALPAPTSRGHIETASRPFPDDHGRSHPTYADDRIFHNTRLQEERYPVKDRERDLRSSNEDARPERGGRNPIPPRPSDALRDTDRQGRGSRESSMGPPRPSIPHPDRIGRIQVASEIDRSQDHTHPDRRLDQGRLSSAPGSQRSSRAASPDRREDSRAPRHDGHRDRERDIVPSLGRYPDVDAYPSPHVHPSQPEEARPPAGPRTGRPGDTAVNVQAEKFRDSVRTSSYSIHSHARTSDEFLGPNRLSDNYGRLNAEPPAGPRTPTNGPSANMGSRRGVSGPQPINTQLSSVVSSHPTASPSAVDRGAPTGPSSSRPNRRDSGGFGRGTPATPVTPVEAPDTAGIHPSRLNNIQSPTDGTPAGAASSAGISIKGQDKLSRVLPEDTRSPPTRPSTRPTNGAAPPQSPQAPPSRHAAPTGPASTAEKSGARERRPWNIVQSQLQQASIVADRGQGTSIRGRGGRFQGGITASPTTSLPTTPAARIEIPDTREELFPNRLNAHPNDANGPPPVAPYDRDGPPRSRDPRQERGREDPGAERRSLRGRDRSLSHERRSNASGPLPPSSTSHFPPVTNAREDPRQQPPPRSRDEGGPHRRDSGRVDLIRGNNTKNDLGGRNLPAPPLANGSDRPPRRGGAHGMGGRDSREDLREPRDTRRREQDDWPGGSGGGSASLDRRSGGGLPPQGLPPQQSFGHDSRRGDDRDRRDGGGSGRKRGRGADDGMPGPGGGMGPDRGFGVGGGGGGGDGGKRPRRGL
ncbi:THO complex subunit 2 [Agyrium rufum]|nr:THO complex subunit 2 [Agyrium rufum]